MNDTHQDKQVFTYTYSARQNEEVKAIRQKYLPKEESKLEQLQRLDRLAERNGTAAALIHGTLSCLVLGVGMCCAMVWDSRWFVPGIVIGVIGLAGSVAAYPLYLHVVKRSREKIAPQILKLTDELIK